MADANDSARGPRVLFVGPGVPWTGGAGFLQREMMWLAALSRRARVTAALFTEESAPPCPLAAEVVTIPMPPSRPRGRLNVLFTDAMNPLPRMALDYDTAPARSRIAALRPGDFDAVFVYRIDCAHFAGLLRHGRLLLDLEDPEHLRKARLLELRGMEHAPPRDVRDHIPGKGEVRVRYYSAYASRRRGWWRRRGVVLAGTGPKDAPNTEHEAEPWPALRARRRRWAELLRLVFKVEVEVCPRCGGAMSIVGFVTEHAVITKILAHLARRGVEARAGPWAAAAG